MSALVDIYYVDKRKKLALICYILGNYNRKVLFGMKTVSALVDELKVETITEFKKRENCITLMVTVTTTVRWKIYQQHSRFITQMK